jgi:hypothetical protein
MVDFFRRIMTLLGGKLKEAPTVNNPQVVEQPQPVND